MRTETADAPAGAWPAMTPEPGRTPRGVWVVSAAVFLALVAGASRYGYHRDELYFLAAGQHPAWAYADQGPLTPLIARAMNELAPGSLTVLRLPSALAAATTVLLTALLARELRAGPRAQLIAAGCSAVSTLVLFTGHTLSTSTFDLLVWTLASWLVVRAIGRGHDRLWPVVGLVLGIGLLNKPLPAFLGVALLAGIAISGPRRLLGNRYVWTAVAVVVTLWSPWLIWQSAHGWPQWQVSQSIASGGSGSSQPWWLIIPFQALLAGPVLAVVWIAGLVRLFRDPALRALRLFGWAWILLALVFMATGGKSYYLAGLLPVLIAAGAQPTETWLRGGVPRRRRATLITAFAVSALVASVISLPVLPARDAGPVVAMNGDVGETIGWPDLVRTVATVRARLPLADHPVILAANYGEAGAVDRYGPALGLPAAYSGHNGFGYWGPPHGDGPVITIGYHLPVAERYLRGCRVAATVHNTAGIGNDEDGVPVLVCQGPRRPWAALWPSLRHLG